jgi:hypothetical protein
LVILFEEEGFAGLLGIDAHFNLPFVSALLVAAFEEKHTCAFTVFEGFEEVLAFGAESPPIIVLDIH